MRGSSTFDTAQFCDPLFIYAAIEASNLKLVFMELLAKKNYYDHNLIGRGLG